MMSRMHAWLWNGRNTLPGMRVEPMRACRIIQESPSIMLYVVPEFVNLPDEIFRCVHFSCKIETMLHHCCMRRFIRQKFHKRICNSLRIIGGGHVTILSVFQEKGSLSHVARYDHVTCSHSFVHGKRRKVFVILRGNKTSGGRENGFQIGCRHPDRKS